MCCNIPSDHTYYLTDFCAGYPHSQTSCGEYCDQLKWFTADRQRFGCNKYLKICGRGKCVNAKVIDAGPAYWVEEDAGKAIIDASPAVCSYISGHSSCGWSDRILITAVVTADITDDQLGPVNVTQEEYNQIVASNSQTLLTVVDENTAIQETPTKSPCCPPTQWEGYRFSWDPIERWNIGWNISYDWDHQRIRILASIKGLNQKKIMMESIAFYDRKTLYVINHDSGLCISSPIESTMQQNCVPFSANHETEITIGESLKADVWSYKFKDESGEGELIDIRSSAQCFPIQTISLDKKSQMDMNMYWDIRQGINDFSVFVPPSNCKTGFLDDSKINSLLKDFTLAVAKAALP
jgi:hypothetical protein